MWLHLVSHAKKKRSNCAKSRSLITGTDLVSAVWARILTLIVGSNGRSDSSSIKCLSHVYKSSHEWLSSLQYYITLKQLLLVSSFSHSFGKLDARLVKSAHSIPVSLQNLPGYLEAAMIYILQYTFNTLWAASMMSFTTTLCLLLTPKEVLVSKS